MAGRRWFLPGFATAMTSMVLTFSGSCGRTDPGPPPNLPPEAPVEGNVEPAQAATSVEQTRHSAFGERAEDRRRMVQTQLESRGIDDPNVIEAMLQVPRHFFVHPRYSALAYGDYPLPIAAGQTISQPYIVAFMTQALKLDSDSKVLEIGTGSGYQAAVCAEIATQVYSIEILETLAVSAEEKLKELGYSNVHVRAGDGYFGWPEEAPFDAIIGTAAAGHIPPPLVEQLAPGGRMILPREAQDGAQYLTLITKSPDHAIQKEDLAPVRFVPMTGKAMTPVDSE